jgi:predicted DNA-binding transcriptional regulator AlpA
MEPKSKGLLSARRIVRGPDILQRTGVSGMTLRRWEAQGLFPKRFKLSAASGRYGACGWDEDEIDAWFVGRGISRDVGSGGFEPAPADPDLTLLGHRLEVSLDFLARQLTRVLDEQRGMREEMRSFRDDMTVLTAIALRLENSVNSLTAQVGTMVAQHRRFDDRLRALEDERR